MKRNYPYLQDSYFRTTLDQEREKRNILTDINNFVNQRQYVRMTLLDWEENPLKDIEGIIDSGSLTKNADSPVRRTCSLSCSIDAHSYDIRDSKMDFSINKKIFIEIGILNETDKYEDWPIFWFPQGIFFIQDFGINSSSSNVTSINLTLKDKMCMLNGDVGGKLPATVVFDTMDTQLPSGEYVTKKVFLYNIIKEAVNHYGNESLNNIVIEDVPLRIKRVMQWTGDRPLYATLGADNVANNNIQYTYTLTKPEDEENYVTYTNGDDIGYIYDDFVFSDDLIGNAGDSVVTILDRIKELLGNYEYFYDEFGIFHFREIKNYLNTTQGKTVLSDMSEKDYLVEINNDKSVFAFTDESLLTSITVTPQYGNIKNDYIVQGLRQMTNSDISYPIIYHLAIDNKPRPIGVDERKKVNWAVDNSSDIADQEKLIEEQKAEIVSLKEKYRTLQSNIDTWQRTVIQRQVEVEQANQEIADTLMGIANVDTWDKMKGKDSRFPSTLTVFLKNWGNYKKPLKAVYLEYQAVLEWSTGSERQATINSMVGPNEDCSEGSKIWQYVQTLIKWNTRLEEEQALINDLTIKINTAKNQYPTVKKNVSNAEEQLSILENQLETIKASPSVGKKDNPLLGQKYYSTNTRPFILYKEPSSETVKAAFIDNTTTSKLPMVGNFNKIYYNSTDKNYYYWNGEIYVALEVVQVYDANEYYTYDWRSKLYLDGLMAAFNADTDKGPYYEELAAFWPTVYNLQKHCFYAEEKTDKNNTIALTQGNYYLDFLDARTSSFSEWSVDNIGRRSDAVVQNDINCLFQPEIPNVILIEVDHDGKRANIEDKTMYGYALEAEKTSSELIAEASANNMPFSQIDDEIYSKIMTGGYKNAAFDQIKYELFLHTRYQKTVSATAIPVFYLEPNSRITISDSTTNTYGDFVLQNINITFGPGANMSISCCETLERF